MNDAFLFGAWWPHHTPRHQDYPVPLGVYILRRGQKSQSRQERVIDIYPILLIDSINFLINGGKTKKQNDKNASFFGKREPSMGYIDFYQTKKKIINFVRAQSSPYPGAYYYLSNGKKIIINKIEESKTKNVIKKIGKIQLLDKKMFVKCNNGILEIIDFEIN